MQFFRNGAAINSACCIDRLHARRFGLALVGVLRNDRLVKPGGATGVLSDQLGWSRAI